MINLLKNRLVNAVSYRIKRKEYEKNYEDYWENFAKTVQQKSNKDLEYVKTASNHPYAKGVTNFVIENLADTKRLLEFGVGYGRIMKIIEKKTKGIELYGVDINEINLTNAKNYLSRTILSKTQPNIIQFSDNFFDLSFTSHVIHHVPPEGFKKICNELIRITKNTIIHVEDHVTYSHSYKHDYLKFYKNCGYKITAYEKPDIRKASTWYLIDLTQQFQECK